jgi:hypothetical protein
MGVLIAGALVLGFVGFGQLQRHSAGTTKLPLPLLDRLYDTVLLFKMTPLYPPPYPWEIEVAQWLAPVAVIYTALSAAAAIFAQQWAELRVRLWHRGHVVVCGLGDCGARLALAFRDRGMRVVAVERALAQAQGSAQAQDWRARGICVISGDATDEHVLLRAGLARAGYLVVVCGDDETNADVALAASRALGAKGGAGAPRQERDGRSVRCFVQVSDDRLCRLLEEAVLARPGRSEVRLEFFNVVRSGLKALLDEYGGALLDASTPPHFVVVGEGRLARQLVAESARRWWLAHGRDGLRCAATLVATGAKVAVTTLEERFPALRAACDLLPCEADPSEPESPPISIELRAPGPRCVAIVCSDNDDAAAVRAAIVVRRSLHDEVPVVVCTRGHSAVPGLLGGVGASGLPNVATFGLLDRVCTPEVLLNGVAEELAQSVHADYLRRRREEIAKFVHELYLEHRQTEGALPQDDQALRPWETLPETLKESNRDQAADIGRKLSLIGCHLEPVPSWDAEPRQFSADELEMLARAEHERWCNERLRQGWQYGEVRDAEAKRNPDLIPWGQLSERSRDLDRDAVRAMPLFLGRLGYAIVPSRAPEPAQEEKVKHVV